MAVDLHLHSTASDGTDPPEQIVALAVEAGLSSIALTDHDNLDGIAPARAAAEKSGITLISGAELSVDWTSTGAIHMLVYWLEPGPGPLQDRLGWLQQGRATRNEQIAQRLQDLGLGVTYDEVVTEAKGRGVGRPHFASILVSKGYVADMSEAFDRYLAEGRAAYVPRERLDAAEAIQLARASGAVPVIAHPHTAGIARDEYRRVFCELTDIGLGGIESYYAEYDPATRAHLASLCNDLGIVATGGSDYHGAYKPGLAIGIGRGDLEVPDDVVDRLEENRAAG